MTKHDRMLVTAKPEKDKKSSPKPKAAQKPAKPEKPKTKAELEADKKKAEEKAKQEAQDCARRAEIKADTDTFFARHGYDESNRYIGKQDAEGEEVQQ